MDAATLALTAAMMNIAIEPIPVAERARQILDVLGRLVPYDAASITVRDPERRARHALAASGEVEGLHAYFESREGDAELERLGLNEPGRALLHTDLPVPAEETVVWTRYLWPAGFGGFAAVGLFTADGRHVGHLTVLTKDPARPTQAERDLIGAVTRVMAHAVDRMRTIRAAAAIVRAAVTGVVLTRGGKVLPLPGFPGHPVLTEGAPALAEAAERLADGSASAVFLHPAAGAALTGELLKVSVLYCGDAMLDHLHATVLVSREPDLRGLSYLDLQVLGFVVDGWPDEQIAAALSIGPREVAGCVRRCTALLGVSSRTGLAVRALRAGLFLPRRPADVPLSGSAPS